MGTIFMNIFSIGIIGGALVVISVDNSIHAILALIVVFLNAAGVMIVMGAEFLGIMFAIVYVGAIAVLFLFIVMMLNIREWKGERRDIWVVMSGMIMGSGILWILLGPALNAVETTQGASNLTKQISGWGSKIEIIPNIEEIGRVLYSGYRYEIIIVGVILLIGMIGAIILTLKVEEVDNRRDIITQIARKAEDVVYLVRR